MRSVSRWLGVRRSPDHLRDDGVDALVGGRDDLEVDDCGPPRRPACGSPASAIAATAGMPTRSSAPSSSSDSSSHVAQARAAPGRVERTLREDRGFEFGDVHGQRPSAVRETAHRTGPWLAARPMAALSSAMPSPRVATVRTTSAPVIAASAATSMVMPVASRLVRHVERDHDRHAGRDHLDGEEEGPAQRRGVDDDDHGLRARAGCGRAAHPPRSVPRATARSGCRCRAGPPARCAGPSPTVNGADTRSIVTPG